MYNEASFDNRPKATKKALNRLPANPEVACSEKAIGPGRFPTWLHRKLPKGGNIFATNKILSSHRLNTVCEEAKCPNRFECYTKKTATFLALGKGCTRNCGFCDIHFSRHPPPPEQDEPIRIAAAVAELGLQHVVVTMVARDDLEDGGASHIVAIVNQIRTCNPDVTIELLTSDFSGNLDALDAVLDTRPEIFNHNIETVRRITPRVRHKATYERTLMVLDHTKRSSQARFVKSGIMVGLGETDGEVEQTLSDLKSAGCDIVTIGHYLQANVRKLTVKNFVSPEQFRRYEQYGYSLGITRMYCGPFVRSSYNAHDVLRQSTL